jgi:TetR/AcrR family transcriptional repressor of bet genes
MPRPPNTSQRKQQIVQSFLKLLSRKGYQGATMKALARACGLTQGLLHYHFHNKREMLEASLKELELRLELRIERRLAPKPEFQDSWKKLEDLVDALLGINELEPADLESQHAWLGLANEALFDEEVREVYAAALLRLQKRLEEVLKNCGRKDAPILSAAMICWIEGAWRVGKLAPGLIPAGSMAPTLKRFLHAV